MNPPGTGIKMFSEANPGFNESAMETYTKLLTAMIVAGTLVMIKRVLFAIVLGKKKHGTSCLWRWGGGA